VRIRDRSPCSHLALSLTAPVALPDTSSDITSAYAPIFNTIDNIAAEFTLNHLSVNDIADLRDISSIYGDEWEEDRNIAPEDRHVYTTAEAKRVIDVSMGMFQTLMQSSIDDDDVDTLYPEQSETRAYGVYAVENTVEWPSIDSVRVNTRISFTPSSPIATNTPREFSSHLSRTDTSVLAAVEGICADLRRTTSGIADLYIDAGIRMKTPKEHVPLILLARVAVAAGIEAMSQYDTSGSVDVDATDDDIERLNMFTSELFSRIHVATWKVNVSTAGNTENVNTTEVEAATADIMAMLTKWN
jgi:hypothetical protein